MTQIETLEQRELRTDLKMLRHFATGFPPLMDTAGSAAMHFAQEAMRFVDALAFNPDASPTELLVLAGEARARLEAAQAEFDMALHHLSQLPVRVDLEARPARPASVRLPEDPRPDEAIDADQPAPEPTEAPPAAEEAPHA